MKNNDRQEAQPQQQVMEEAQAAPHQAIDETQAATSEIHDDPGLPQQEQQQQQGIVVGEPDPGSPGGEPLSEDALGIGIEDISADPSASDLFGDDDFLSTLPVYDDFSPDFPEDELAGSDPKVTMNPEELSGPETAQEPGFEDDISDWDSSPEDCMTGTDPHPWELGISDTPDTAATTDVVVDPIPTYQAEPLDSEAAEPLSPEAISMPIDKIVKPVPTDQGEELPGDSGEEGYDPDPDVYGPGITPDESYEILKDWSDELDDSNYGPDDEHDPENEHVPDYAPEENYGPNYNPYFEFGPADEHDPDVEGDHDPSVVGEEDAGEAGSDPAEVDYQAVLDDLASGNIDKVRDFIQNLAHGDEETEDATQSGYDGSGIAGGLDLDEDGVFDRLETNPKDISDEGYTYDEGAYEDAEDAFEDLQDALQDGDEEDLAEALQKLHGYLGGFDKGAAEDEDRDLTGGDTEELPNTVDKEPVDAPDASGVAVSGAAVGTTAAVGAGVVGRALDGATEQAGGAIDEALGIEGSGEILSDVINGDWDRATDAISEIVDEDVEEHFGIEGAGHVVGGVIKGDWDKVTDALPGVIGEGVEEYFGIEGAGDVVENVLEGDWEEVPGDVGDLAGSAVGAYFGGPVGAAIGGEIGEFVGEGAGEVIQEAGEVFEDVGDAIGGAVDTIGGWFD